MTLKCEDDLSDMVVMFLSEYGDVSKVESKLSSPGIPDINFQNSHTHEWLELKFIKIGDTDIGIRPTQYQWFRNRVKFGGNPAVLVYVESTGTYHLVHGSRVWTASNKLNKLSQLEAASFSMSGSLSFVLGAFIRPMNGK